MEVVWGAFCLLVFLAGVGAIPLALAQQQRSTSPSTAIRPSPTKYLSGTLRGIDVPTGQVLWSFAGDGGLKSAPVIVNQTIYIGSSSGTLFGLNLTGQQIWSAQVGAPIPPPDEHNAVLTTGLGAGDGLLFVPAGTRLVAYGN